MAKCLAGLRLKFVTLWEKKSTWPHVYYSSIRNICYIHSQWEVQKFLKNLEREYVNFESFYQPIPLKLLKDKLSSSANYNKPYFFHWSSSIFGRPPHPTILCCSHYHKAADCVHFLVGIPSKRSSLPRWRDRLPVDSIQLNAPTKALWKSFQAPKGDNRNEMARLTCEGISTSVKPWTLCCPLLSSQYVRPA